MSQEWMNLAASWASVSQVIAFMLVMFGIKVGCEIVEDFKKESEEL